MDRLLCSECNFDITPRVLERFGNSIRLVYPQMMQVKRNLEASGLKDITKVDVGIGGLSGEIRCPNCETFNEVELNSIDQIEALHLEMNR